MAFTDGFFQHFAPELKSPSLRAEGGSRIKYD